METANKTKVPADLESRISELIDTMDAAERLAPRKKPHCSPVCISAVAAAILVASLLGIRLRETNVPADTFSDPELAYSAAEKALYDITEMAGKAMDRAGKAEKAIVRTKSIFD